MNNLVSTTITYIFSITGISYKRPTFPESQATLMHLHSSMMTWVERICKQSLLMLRDKCPSASTNYGGYLDFWRLVSPTRIVLPSLELPVQANLSSSSSARLFPHLWWHFSIHTVASSILLQETPKMHLLHHPTPTNSYLRNQFRTSRFFFKKETNLERVLNLIRNLPKAIEPQRRLLRQAIR